MWHVDRFGVLAIACLGTDIDLKTEGKVLSK